jgi:hypothetical protein
MGVPGADHLAGLCDEWKNRETRERIYAMIITEPNDDAEVHDHMPSERRQT